MTAPGLSTVAALLGREIGLRLDAAMTARLGRCLRDLAQMHATTVEAVAGQVQDDPRVRQQLLDLITVQESWFFRDPAQFEALARHVLPLLPSPVRIWVAGCANGQEAYSIAMVLSEAEHPDAKVVATDVSTAALERARLGSYDKRELRGLSDERRARFLRPRGGRFVVTDELRQRLQVQRQNLARDPLPLPAGSASVVFCRNVLIYFRAQDVPGAVCRVASALSGGGLLFSGVSEAHWQVKGHFELTRLGEAFVYRLGTEQRVAGRSPVVSPISAPRHRRPRPPKADQDELPGPEVTAVTALRAGEQAAADGDQQGAIVLFRRAAYLDPSLPMAHLQLGIALESIGDQLAAVRAYRAARQSLDPRGAEHDLAWGYSTDVLRRHLDVKLARRETSG